MTMSSVRLSLLSLLVLVVLLQTTQARERPVHNGDSERKVKETLAPIIKDIRRRLREVNDGLGLRRPKIVGFEWGRDIKNQQYRKALEQKKSKEDPQLFPTPQPLFESPLFKEKIGMQVTPLPKKVIEKKSDFDTERESAPEIERLQQSRDLELLIAEGIQNTLSELKMNEKGIDRYYFATNSYPPRPVDVAPDFLRKGPAAGYHRATGGGYQPPHKYDWHNIDWESYKDIEETNRIIKEESEREAERLATSTTEAPLPRPSPPRHPRRYEEPSTRGKGQKWPETTQQQEWSSSHINENEWNDNRERVHEWSRKPTNEQQQRVNIYHQQERHVNHLKHQQQQQQQHHQQQEQHQQQQQQQRVNNRPQYRRRNMLKGKVYTVDSQQYYSSEEDDRLPDHRDSSMERTNRRATETFEQESPAQIAARMFGYGLRR